jgi:hypothetical protein
MYNSGANLCYVISDSNKGAILYSQLLGVELRIWQRMRFECLE